MYVQTKWDGFCKLYNIKIHKNIVYVYIYIYISDMIFKLSITMYVFSTTIWHIQV